VPDIDAGNWYAWKVKKRMESDFDRISLRLAAGRPTDALLQLWQNILSYKPARPRKRPLANDAKQKKNLTG
jgi:hypothetical protein